MSDVVELFLQVDDFLLEFLGLCGNSFFETSSLILDGIKFEVLSLSVLSSKGISKLGKSLLSHESLISKSSLRVSNGSAESLYGIIDLLLGPFCNSVNSGVELLELIAEVVVELSEEGVVGRVRVWRVLSSWGNMLAVSVLSILSDNSLGKVSLEELSLLVKSASKLSSSLCEGCVESIVVNFNSSVKLSLSIDFGLSKVVSKFLAEGIEVISLSLAE